LKSAPDAPPGSDSERLYGIAELADEFGITARAIRFYEAKGLLTPPRVNGGRVYSRRDRARLKLILRAKSIGFSLAEVKQFISLYGDRGEGRPQQMAFVAGRSGFLIKELEQKQADLAATIDELREIRRQCLAYLAEQGEPCERAEDAEKGESAPKKARKSRTKDE
jgi:DNA-binding transcriptional MerR regulator